MNTPTTSVAPGGSGGENRSSSNNNSVKVVAGYALQQKLGSGSFAVVYKGVKLQPTGDDDDHAAIKAIARNSERLTAKVLQNLEFEISILRTYRHKNIVCMHNVQKTTNHFYMILEYCAGGDVQGLIRSRRTRRLSEGLTRRLMRDLAHGLQFLWSQELIHRDIKPQNLLLTGPLPLDEINDPAKTVDAEEQRQMANFPTEKFCLKIADFGFARHLQTTSLAETLCGSPLYMAPEILQHHRYDAKADLWSVGTVLFEMISGEPPFHGENHIDLLRNIQRKAVRLPKDVRVSKECVNLLRLLLSRNPLSRAGFKEFFDACGAFVALGCNGSSVPLDEGTCTTRPAMDLGPIPENPNPSTTGDSLMTVATNAPEAQQHVNTRTTSPPGSQGSTPSKSAPIPVPQVPVSTAVVKPRSQFLSPLIPSPPTSAGIHMPPVELQTFSSKKSPQQIEMSSRRSIEEGTTATQLQNSMDENSFVMVEHGGPPTPADQTSTAVVSHHIEKQETPCHIHLQSSPPSTTGLMFHKSPIQPSKGEYMVVQQPPQKGMLSTSPGTGGALMGLFAGRLRLTSDKSQNSEKQLDIQIKATSKMLAASEDVGRRAVSVAHLGDKQAYLAMRMVMMNESSTSSVLSVTPMEGIEEEEGDDHESGAVTDDSSCTEIMATVRRRRSSSSVTDRSMTEAKPDPDMDDMPFAVKTEPTPIVTAGFPSRASVSFTKDTTITTPRTPLKPKPSIIRSRFSEALSCYVKSLQMLKGAVGAAEGVSKELDALIAKKIIKDQEIIVKQLRHKCEVTQKWLGSQFQGVLERADAANTELNKLPSSQMLTESQPSSTSVEELLYTNALGLGREGAVKQLLGHYESARSCYRSAGLLAETLLMETKIEGNDRKILETYVDGFAAQIRELDDTMLQQSQQSRMLAGSGSANTATSLSSSFRRAAGPHVIGSVSHPFAVEQPTNK